MAFINGSLICIKLAIEVLDRERKKRRTCIETVVPSLRRAKIKGCQRSLLLGGGNCSDKKLRGKFNQGVGSIEFFYFMAGSKS